MNIATFQISADALKALRERRSGHIEIEQELAT